MSPLSRLAARSIVWLRWPILLAWIAATVAAVVYLPALEDAGDETSLVGLVPQDAEALAAGVRAAELFDVPVVTHTHVVQRDPEGLPRTTLSRVARSARAVSEGEDEELKEIRFALPLVNVRDLVPSSRESGTTAITYLFFDPRETSIDDQEELTARYAQKYAGEPRDALVGIAGAVPARMEEWRQIERGLPWVTLATIALIALILGIHFRSPFPALVALGAAGVAYVVSLRAVGWVGGFLGVTIPRDAEPVLVVLLLGVVTDYAVFFLHGTRERIERGQARVAAATDATAEYLPIVVTAGLIVAGGTAALVVGELDFFRAFGPGMALTVLISLAVAITIVPALMAILGRRAFWPDEVGRQRAEPGPGRVAFFATARPVALVIAVIATAGLILAGRGLLETNLGLTQIQGLPAEASPKRAQAAAAAGFSAGILSPTVLLLEGVDRRDLPALIRLQRALGEEPGIAAAIGPGTRAAESIPDLVISQDARATRYLLVLDREPLGGPAIDAVAALRERLPSLLADADLPDAQARLAGDTALAEETVDTIKSDLVRIAVVAFLVNVLLLAIFLRALIAPLYLVLASALALAASIGLTTLVFQRLLGYGELTYHVPFAVAVLLLSLGSDYNVFVVGRIWQASERMPVREAIATAAPRASRAIGVAGLALACSFAALALIDLRQFREFAFAMFVGILLDAFLIRALLIPALVSLVGEKSWWPGVPRGPAWRDHVEAVERER